MLERDVVKAALRYAKSLGVPYIRMFFGHTAMQAAGWPDILFLIPGGRPLFIEFKAPGKKPTPRQTAKIELLNRLRYDVRVCDTPESAKEALQDALQKAQG